METGTRKPKEASATSKEKIAVYIDRRLARRLKHERAATDKSMSLIVEEALVREFKRRPPTLTVV